MSGLDLGQLSPLQWLQLGAAVAITALLSLILWRRYQSRRALMRRVAELSLLSQAGARIVEAQLDVDELCALIYEQARQMVFAPTYQIGLFDHAWYDIRFWLVRGERRPPERFNLMDAKGEGLVGWSRRTRQSLVVGDFQVEAATLPARPRYTGEEPPRSALIVPMLAGAEAVGAIVVQSDEPRAFTQDHERLLSIVANQAAAAIQNARLLQRKRTRARQLELIGDVSRQVAAILDLDELFQRVATLVQETFGYYCVEVLTLEPERQASERAGGRLILEATTSTGNRQRGLPIELGEGIIGWVAVTGQTALVNDVSDDPRYRYLPALSETRAELAVPLKIEDQVLGVLDVQSARVDAFDDDDRFVLETLADQVAVAIHEARLYHAARRRAAQLDAIAQVSRAVVSLLDLDELLVQVADLIAGRFRYPQVSIFLLDPGNGDAVFRAGTGALADEWRQMGLRYAADSEGLIPWTARYGEPLVVRDVLQEPRYRTGPGEEGVGSEMCVPLRMGGDVLGVLDVSSPEVGAFGEEDQYVVQMLADAVAIAVRNATLYAAERRRREAAEALRQAAETLTSTLDLQHVLDRMLEGLAGVVPYDAAAILLLGGGDLVTVAAARGLSAVVSHVGNTLPLADSERLREIGLSHRPLIFTEVDATGAYHALLGLPADHSCLSAPLLARDELIGFLALDALLPGRYDTEDAEVLMTFAHQVAIAIENARLITTQREEAWVSTALLQVAEATGRATELEEVLATVTRITPLLVGIDRCGLLLWDEELQVWRGTHAYQIEGGWIDAFAGVRVRPQEWPALDRMQARGEPVTIEQAIPEAAYAPGSDGAALESADPLARMPDEVSLVFGQLALLLLPLLAKGHVMGGMLVGHNEPAFSQRRIDLIGGIANQAALAIEGAQLYTAQQEEVWVSTALLQVAEAVGSLTDLDQVLETIVRLAPLLLGVQHCVVLLWDEGHGVFVPEAAFGLTPHEREHFEALQLHPSDYALLDATRQGGRPVAAGPDRQFPLPEELSRVFGVEGLLALPLVSKGKFLGALLVDWPAAAERTGQRRLNILVGMAHQAAVAIENAQLYTNLAVQQRIERELEVAREIQMSFLPDKCPEEPGWDMAAYYQAAYSVGGDFYDFIRLPDNRWGMIVADVSDKGVPAALFMALSRTLLRAVALSGRTPGASLVRVNDLLLADARSDLFVTGFYAAWSPENHRLVYANAGHNPPLLVAGQPGDEAPANRWLTGKGIALGVVPHIQLEEQVLHMNPGDVVVLYTDGVTEALRHDMAEFGVQRLSDTVSAHRHERANDIINAVRRDVDEFVGNMAQFDDFTMVVLKRL